MKDYEVKKAAYFVIYDTHGKARHVYSGVSDGEMRILLSIFKTHCATEGTSYEYNHFVNWVKKYHDIDIEYAQKEPTRIDM